MATSFKPYLTSVAPLAARANAWRLGLTAVLAATGQTVATVIVFAAFAYFAALLTNSRYDQIFVELTLLTSPLALIATLLTFSGVIFAVFISMRLLHKAPLSRLFSITGSFDRTSCWKATFVLLVLGMSAFLISMPYQPYRANLHPEIWMYWVIPALLSIFVQVFSEELVFRGYLQSMIASRFRHPAAWIGIPTLLFGLLHLPTALPFGTNAWLILAAPTLLGGIGAHMTARTGGIAVSTGLHFANNCLGVLLVSLPGPFGTLSLFTYDFDIADIATVRPMILTNLGLILLAYVVLLFMTRNHPARLQQQQEVFK